MKTNPDQKFCVQCGEQIHVQAEICPKCGVRQFGNNNSNNYDPNAKDWLTTLLLCIFAGGLGIHRFYTGHTGIGIIQLLTGGGCGIWALIDLITIATNSYRDAEGKPLRKS